MHFKSKQEAFETAVAGLAAQGFQQSRGTNGRCLFRGEAGMKCAVGQLITDDELRSLTPALRENSHSVVDLITIDDLTVGMKAGFLYALQDPHDYGRSPEGMKEQLQEFADLHDLAMPVLP